MTEAALVWRCPDCGATAAGAGGPPPCPRCGRRTPRRDGVWRFRPGFEPAGFAPRRRDHLRELRRDHFWFPPRDALLCRLLDRCAGGPFDAALEVGCGDGGFLLHLARRCRRLVGLDAYDASLLRARRRAPRAVLVQGDLARVPLADGQLDLAVALDVLEHVEPEAALAELHRLVRPGGRLLLSVPASPALWSRLDVAAGHRRRYRRRDLEAGLAAAGWQPVDATHYQFLLFPLVWLSRRLGLHAVERRPPAPLNRLLGLVDALEVQALGGLSLPWGSSLLCLARRLA